MTKTTVVEEVWCSNGVVICSKFITFAVTKTTSPVSATTTLGCDLLKIHYLCGDKDNYPYIFCSKRKVVICSKFITFAVTKTTASKPQPMGKQLWFAQNSLPLRWQRQLETNSEALAAVVICSKFITFAVTKTTRFIYAFKNGKLWFAQNSLPLRWQRQHVISFAQNGVSCDLLKIHYLCGDKDNGIPSGSLLFVVVICSKFITFAVTKTTRDGGGNTRTCCDLLKIHYLCGDKDNMIS